MKLIIEVIGFGMSAFFILVLLARLILKNIHGMESVTASQAQDMPDSETEHSINGLKPVVVTLLPAMEFNSDTFCSKEDAQCSICLEQYKDKELLQTVPRCGHHFHQTCLETWFQKQSTCPICRLSLNDSSEAKHTGSPAFSNTV